MLVRTLGRALPPLLLALLLGAAPVEAGCDTAQALYTQALAAATPQAKAALLKASLAACPSGLAWLELGRVHLALGFLSQAEKDLSEGLKWTGEPGERASILAELGRVYQGMRSKEEALAAYEQSLRLRPDPRVQTLLQDLQSDPGSGNP